MKWLKAKLLGSRGEHLTMIGLLERKYLRIKIFKVAFGLEAPLFIQQRTAVYVSLPVTEAHRRSRLVHRTEAN